MKTGGGYPSVYKHHSITLDITEKDKADRSSR